MELDTNNDDLKSGPVTSAVQQALSGTAHDRRVELLGKVVGDYRLVAIVGVGGVGTVYLGERADRAYSAQVAIKVVANSQLSHEVQRRFAAERQILANLNHPYIGRLLDAGETFFDEPYLVMEYVHGEAMDRYCDNQRLTVLERLELFLKVCDAVQYAHRNLIVHRDLKPGNILVSKEGIPKLLDFGIAKLLDESAQAVLQDGLVAHTRVHDRLLTPEYASPEQIRGQPVTTTSDVYALGMILYELLTGVRPYTVNALNQLELERSICIQDPLKPSQMAAALSKDVTSTTPLVKDASLIPTARKTTFAKLEAQLKGDLDAIVMKALRKEPEHRYSSVEHFIEDIQRHLHEEPVEARQGTQWYYTQRFIKRHTLGVISATTALLALIAVAIILSIQATKLKEQRDIANQQRDKATQESERAETVSNFMLDVFTAADPFQSQDKQITAKELLDKAANKIETSLTDQPEVKARLLKAIGQAYVNQGRVDDAIKYFEQSLKILRSSQSLDVLNVVDLLEETGKAYFEREDIPNAERLLEEARTLLERNRLTGTQEYLQVLYGSGSLERDRSHLESAKKYFLAALELSKKLNGEPNIETINLMRQVTLILDRQAKYEASNKLYVDLVNLAHRALPEKHPDRIRTDVAYGMNLYSLNRPNEALSILSKALDDQKAIYSNDGIRLVPTYSYISKTQLRLGNVAAAEDTARTSLKLAIQSTRQSNDYYEGIAYLDLADVLIRRQKFMEGRNAAQTGFNILNKITPQGNQFPARAQYLIAWSSVGLNHLAQAKDLLQKNIERWMTVEGPPGWPARSENLLGLVSLKLGEIDAARKLLTDSYAVLSKEESGADPLDVEIARRRNEQFKRCEAEHRLNNCELEI